MRKLRLREVKQFAQGPHSRRLSPSPDSELFLWPPRLLLSVGAERPELRWTWVCGRPTPWCGWELGIAQQVPLQIGPSTGAGDSNKGWETPWLWKNAPFVEPGSTVWRPGPCSNSALDLQCNMEQVSPISPPQDILKTIHVSFDSYVIQYVSIKYKRSLKNILWWGELQIN